MIRLWSLILILKVMLFLKKPTNQKFKFPLVNVEPSNEHSVHPGSVNFNGFIIMKENTVLTAIFA